LESKNGESSSRCRGDLDAKARQQSPLTAAPFAQWLLDSARYYETKQRWHITLFLLMPDHLQSRKHGIIWQEGCFDHRLMNAASSYQQR